MQTQPGLEAVIRTRIAQEGAISIAEYMALCLSHPEYGYYMRKDPLGVFGDFTTAPEISQIFGELTGLWLCEQWRIMGKPRAALVELGPGRGTLMADMLRITRAIPGFHDAVSVHLVETSPALKQKQWNALAGKHTSIEWHENIATLPDQPWLLTANEFFDALPIHQYTQTPQGWCERMVGLDAKGRFCFALKTLPLSPALKEDGIIYEHSPAAEAITVAISKHIKSSGGAALIFDYGYTSGTRGDTLQALKNHRYHDPLQEPGEADITAHVDFRFLQTVAISAGAGAFGPLPQGVFLEALGARMRALRLCEKAGDAQKASVIAGLERLLSPDQMGDLFKVLCITPLDYPKPEGF